MVPQIHPTLFILNGKANGLGYPYFRKPPFFHMSEAQPTIEPTISG